ncbi:general secretion pathway protein E [Methylomarinovum caldicuralii]|uniref:Type II secretion system protein E n=1 Tax=Methylomarinovum caldicuralii TaxID=438856 RepID=A0AAU9C479_9GAMM|nr:type II secretion system ATPase GspE [Methylomarinovum caldicuralii]BCX81975.1 general secretion pathway protein E [Methylomarinovum caldicuralii]
MAVALETYLSPPDYETFAARLLETGRLRPADLNRARRLLEEGDDSLPLLLVKLGLVAERDVAEALAQVTGLPLADANAYPDAPVLPETVSLRFLKTWRAVGLAATEAGYEVAVADPLDGYLRQALQLACDRPLSFRVGLASDIDNALRRQYEQEAAAPDLTESLDDADVEHLRDMASEAPVIRSVNQILQQAVELRASDIHIEPFEDQLQVRLRIDGILRPIDAPPVRSAAAVISRVKLMANLNIAERRLPQDGRIKVQVQGRELDLRVSTVPTLYGESVVIRLLDKEQVTLDFATLGFADDTLARFLKVLNLPHGILLITGPTGSGKSTTLYTALDKLNTAERKIITVEDPVEYQLTGVNQIQVKPDIGLDFAGALRAIVRQDPDVIMIGEMRDLETARIAVQSALTGHLVLSTLHTNDAAGGVTRLLDMGLEDYLISSTVNGILAQRLVRRLCDHCKQPKELLPEAVEETGLAKLLRPGQKPVLYQAAGCDHCNGIGYRGRLAIHEFLEVSDTIRRQILQHAQAREIEQTALSEGMRTMYQDGLLKALAGQTTLEEILRVTCD